MKSTKKFFAALAVLSLLAGCAASASQPNSGAGMKMHALLEWK